MKDFLLVIPEIILLLTLISVMLGEITYHGERLRLVSVLAVTGLAGAFVQTLLSYGYGTAKGFNGAITVDAFSLFFKLVFILLAALSVIFVKHSKEIPDHRQPECYALILASSLAMCIASSASDLFLVFVSLQFVNVTAYFLVGFAKNSARSIEAAGKYLLSWIVAGAFFLYGFALLYMSTDGAFNIYDIRAALMSAPLSHETALVVFVLIFFAMSFQTAAFPMHFWAPDVAQGAPTPASAFITVGVRIAGFAVMVRMFLTVFSRPDIIPGQWVTVPSIDWTEIVGIVSGLTLVMGALLSLKQRSVSRMVGYLIIAQTGFFLMGLLVLDQVGIAAILYNLIIEVFALVGAFYVASFVARETGADTFRNLKGLLRRAPLESICLILCLLCLAGVPPMPGFIGKFALIGAAVRHQWFTLAVVGACCMAFSAVAVARLAFCLIGDFERPTALSAAHGPYADQHANPESNPEKNLDKHFERRLFLAVAVVPIAIVGVFAEPVLDWAGKSLGFILW